jgi:hypothetical protein
MLAERISMQLFRRLAIPAPLEAHTRLYVNGEYAGLYMIVESIDKAFLRRNYFEDAGYLYDYEYPGPYYLEYLGSNPGLYVPLPFQPETHETDPRPEYIERLIWTINETTDTEFRSAIDEYLDLAAFVRHAAVEAFLAETDGLTGDTGTNNFFLYRFADSTRFTFIPWDKGWTFISPAYSVFRNLTDVPEAVRNRLVMRALSHPDLYDAYLDTLLECARVSEERDETWPDEATRELGWLAREVERQYSQIRAAALDDQVKPFPNDEFERAVDSLRTFAAVRAGLVSQEVEQVRAQSPFQAARRPSNGRRPSRSR